MLCLGLDTKVLHPEKKQYSEKIGKKLTQRCGRNARHGASGMGRDFFLS